MRFHRSWLFPLVVTLLAGSASVAHGQTPRGRLVERQLGRAWVVDQAGGPGTDFVSLPEAVAAAGSGDVLLVRTGTYDGFELLGKGLSIVGDGAVPTIREQPVPLTIRDLLAGESVVLRSLTVNATAPFQDNAGSIWVEDCTIEQGSLLYGLHLTDCASVVLVRTSVPGLTFLFGGGAAVEAIRSNVHVFDCTFEGTSWFPSINGGPSALGDPGGDGMRLEDSFLYATGSTFVGGQGEVAPCDPGGCGIQGGTGGAGLDASAAGTPPITLACTFQGGPGGPSDSSPFCISCPGGPKGPKTRGTVVKEPLPLRSYEVETPVRSGSSFLLIATCVPGDQVWSVFSTGLDTVYEPLLFGTRIGLVSGLVQFEGVAGPSTTLLKNVAVPPIASLAPFGRVYAQGLFFDTFGAYLGTPSLLLVVP